MTTSNGIIKQLYRRSGVSYSDSTVREITSGYTETIDFDTPGYISFDFRANIPLPDNGNIQSKYIQVYVNGVLRFEVRGGWAWNRKYLYVDEGRNTIQFKTEGYGGSDEAHIRRLVGRFFVKVPCLMIEATAMPKSLEVINSYQIVDGTERYQHSGKRGSEMEFVLVFNTMTQWKNFNRYFEQNYVIKGDYGTYGGVLLPQETETVRKGGLIFTKTKLQSPNTVGVGVDGL